MSLCLSQLRRGHRAALCDDCLCSETYCLCSGKNITAQGCQGFVPFPLHRDLRLQVKYAQTASQTWIVEGGTGTGSPPVTAVHDPGRRRRSIPALFLGGGVLRRKRRWTEQRYHKFVNSQRLNYADVCCPSARDRDCSVFLETRERDRERQRETERERETESRKHGQEAETGREGRRMQRQMDGGRESNKRGQDKEIKGRGDREGTQRESQGRRGINSG